MNKKAFFRFFLNVFFLLFFLNHAAASTSIEAIKWQDWSDSVFEQAKKNHRLIMVYASAPWCHWCQKMQNVTLQDSEIIHVINQSYIPVFLDIDKNTALATKLRVIDLPTTIIFDSNHQIIKIFSGYFSPEIMKKNLLEVTVSLSSEKPKSNLPLSKELRITSEILSLNGKENQAKEMLIKKNLFSIIFGFWFFGFLLAFTPCVLPLIVIIAGLLSGRMGTISKGKIISLSFTYVFALSITYSIAGMIAAFYGVWIQAYLQKPWVLIVFSLILFVLALSLFDFYRLKLPNRLQRFFVKFNKFRDHYTYAQVATMGTFATLIASPCTAAPLLGVLGYAGIQGSAILGAIALFAVGLGIGTPLIIASFVGIKILPQTHEWQRGIKIFFGFFLIGIAIWILTRIIPPSVIMMLWGILLLFAAISMGVLKPSKKSILWKLWKIVSIFVLMYGIVLMVGAFMGNTDPIRPLHFNEKAPIVADFISTHT